MGTHVILVDHRIDCDCGGERRRRAGSNDLALRATIVFFPAALGLYFSPAIVAWVRDHRNKMPIGLVNLFLGWTILGWVGALVWAYSAADPAPSLAGASASPASTKTCPVALKKCRAQRSSAGTPRSNIRQARQSRGRPLADRLPGAHLPRWLAALPGLLVLALLVAASCRAGLT